MCGSIRGREGVHSLIYPRPPGPVPFPGWRVPTTPFVCGSRDTVLGGPEGTGRSVPDDESRIEREGWVQNPRVGDEEWVGGRGDRREGVEQGRRTGRRRPERKNRSEKERSTMIEKVSLFVSDKNRIREFFSLHTFTLIPTPTNTHTLTHGHNTV